MSELKKDPSDSSEPKRKVSTRSILAAVVAILLVVAIIAGAAFWRQSPVEPGSEPLEDTPAATEPQEEDPGENAGSAESSCAHDWTITYKTVHHETETHDETVPPVYADETTYHTVCNECGQVIDGEASQHIKETGHSGYSTNVPITNEVLVSEGYTKEIIDTPAYDETVADEMVCTLCGETQSIEQDDVTD